MSNTPDPKDNSVNIDKDKEQEKPKSKTEEKQQKTDPQLTELKGLIDPDEPIEVKGTDNPF